MPDSRNLGDGLTRVGEDSPPSSAALVAALAKDEAVMFRMGSIQHDLDPNAKISDSLRATIIRLAAEDTTALAAALCASATRLARPGTRRVNATRP